MRVLNVEINCIVERTELETGSELRKFQKINFSYFTFNFQLSVVLYQRLTIQDILIKSDISTKVRF